MSATPSEDFWRFSTAFYENPVHRQSLLYLQDECGVDVAFVLLALWHGAITHDAWLVLFKQSRSWREELAQLRQLRKQNKTRFSDLHYYQSLKAAELAFEQHFYTWLAQYSQQNIAPNHDQTVAQCLHDLMRCYEPTLQTKIARTLAQL